MPFIAWALKEKEKKKSQGQVLTHTRVSKLHFSFLVFFSLTYLLLNALAKRKKGEEITDQQQAAVSCKIKKKKEREEKKREMKKGQREKQLA